MHLEERGGTGGCFLKEFTVALRFKRRYSRSKSNTLIRKKMLNLCSNFPSKYKEMKVAQIFCTVYASKMCILKFFFLDSDSDFSMQWYKV